MKLLIIRKDVARPSAQLAVVLLLNIQWVLINICGAPNFLKLGAPVLPSKKVNFEPCVHLKCAHYKANLTAPDNSTKLPFALIRSTHTCIDSVGYVLKLK